MLLVREEEAIERAALCFSPGDPGLVLLVCAPAVRELTRACFARALAGMSLDDPVALRSGEEVVAALSEDDSDRASEVLVLAVPAAEPVVEALNWHREKLRRRSRPVLLWMDHPEALALLRERAPDAYSFRDDVVEIEGFTFPLIPPPEEPASLRRARRRYERAKTTRERVIAASGLLLELRTTDALDEVVRIGEMTLTALKRLDLNDDELVHVLGTVAHESAAAYQRLGSAAQAVQIRLETAGSLLSDRATHHQSIARFRLLSEVTAPPLWIDPDVATDAVDRLLHLASTIANTNLRDTVLGVIELQGARTREAVRKLSNARLHPGVPRFDAAVYTNNHAMAQWYTGHLCDAETSLRSSAHAFRGRMSVSPLHELAQVLCDMGELAAASRLITCLPTPREADAGTEEKIELVRGDAIGFIEHLRRRATLALQEKLDLIVLQRTTQLVDGVELALDAGIAIDLPALDEELSSVSESLYAFTDPFPWYRVMMPSLRARLLARAPETLDRAIELQREVYTRAKTAHRHIAPSRGRLLADHLVRAARYDEALAVCAEAEELALARLRPRDRAEVIATRIRALVATNAPDALRAEAVTAMEAALDETGAPRPRAEVWLALARVLPPATTTPDPLRLADDARARFEAMPMPLPEGECALVAGDVLLARGEIDEALARYRIARRRHARHSIGLFMPRIDARIAAAEAKAREA